MSEQETRSNKKKWLIILGLLLVFAIAIYVTTRFVVNTSGNSAANEPAPAAQVDITATEFSPATVRVKVGQSVTWTNKDGTAHEMQLLLTEEQSNDESFDAEPLQPNDSYTYTFRNKGTYTYVDQRNAESLRGTVTVE